MPGSSGIQHHSRDDFLMILNARLYTGLERDLRGIRRGGGDLCIVVAMIMDRQPSSNSNSCTVNCFGCCSERALAAVLFGAELDVGRVRHRQ